MFNENIRGVHKGLDSFLLTMSRRLSIRRRVIILEVDSENRSQDPSDSVDDSVYIF